ncbi:MAG: efflux RND transporter periplasmic adaptor subunit [Gammaproteobacteria bacterium]|jgi:membrane fusion protein (multidrug efflux system)|nr:efflux RND transporter periplasmic adaptor subunit [Gammaproteobacteria bacterium]
MRRISGVNKPFARIAASAVALVCMFVATACTQDAGGEHMNTTQRQQQVHLVELTIVQVQALRYLTDRAGSLRASRQVKVFNQEEGRITKVLVHEGDWVRPGQVLVRLDDRLLRAELDKIMATLRQAEADVKRLQSLNAKRLVAEEQLNRTRTTLEISRAEERLLGARIGYMTIAAPFAGRIAQRLIEPGDVAPKHTHLLTLIDPSSLVTDVQVSELVLPDLKVGDSADVRIDALGEQAYRGRILRIYPTIDPSTRLGQIEVALNPVPEGARPGQFCRVTLRTGDKARLVIPLAALRRDGEDEYVFLFNHEDSKVRRMTVHSGVRLADMIEIRAGLKAGERIVAKGFLGLSDGQVVKPVNAEQAGPAGNA